jgi:peptide/nickel transport system permease protein
MTTQVARLSQRQSISSAAKPRSQRAIVWRQLRRNRGAMMGLALLCVLGLCAVFAPVLAPNDPVQQHYDALLLPPGPKYLLGTDHYGRDILSRLLYGARISLPVGLVSIAIGASVGTLLGLVSGYLGGLLDGIILRIIDVMLAFPGILLALAVVAILGPNLFNVMLAVGISTIPSYTRVVRGSVLSSKQNLYVDAARVVGATSKRIMILHILPNVLAPIVVLSTLSLAGAILGVAGLSFLGLGAQPPTPEWGAMLSAGREVLRRAWWPSTFPGLAIMTAVLSINLLGDALRDALDPRLSV